MHNFYDLNYMLELKIIKGQRAAEAQYTQKCKAAALQSLAQIWICRENKSRMIQTQKVS